MVIKTINTIIILFAHSWILKSSAPLLICLSVKLRKYYTDNVLRTSFLRVSNALNNVIP